MMVEENGYRLDWAKIKKDWPLWIFFAGLIAGALLVYPHLPEQIPSHWNMQGQVDQYSSRFFGAFFFPLLIVAIYLLFLLIPLVDPQRNNYARFPGAYRLLRWAVPLCLSVLYITTILTALGYRIDIPVIVKSMISVLFIVIGNLMGQLRFNYFVGVRTPWTLANEEVWRLTHRLSARVWVVGGLVCLISSFIAGTPGAVLFFTSAAVMAIVPMVYSYLKFVQINGN